MIYEQKRSTSTPWILSRPFCQPVVANLLLRVPGGGDQAIVASQVPSGHRDFSHNDKSEKWWVYAQ